jgi:3-isopropylmalate dehydrogenase
MLRYSFGMEKEASAIESAVKQTIRDGFRSGDISSGSESVGTTEMGEAIIERLPA